jgi:protein ImuA
MRTSPQHLAGPPAGEDPYCPRPGREVAASRLAALRAVALPLQGEGSGARFSLGDESLDGVLAASARPGLKAAALHEVAALEAGDAAAAFGFALMLAFRAAGARKPILLVMEENAVAECGAPDGHGLAAHGLDPARLSIVRARRAAEALWAFEEGLRCPALGAALCAVPRLPAAYDLTASRRFVLAARASGVTGVFAVLAESGAAGRIASAAETRWEAAARRSAIGEGGEPGPVRLAAHLCRRRGGDPADFDLEWSHEHHRLRSLGAPGRAPLPVARTAASADRPHPAARAGQGRAG